jgi:3-oxoacyl-[acyl-carrier-protein] synthase II
MGHDLESVWKRLCNGDTAVAPIERFNASSFPTTFANEVKDYDWRQFVDDPDRHGVIGAHAGFALGAARQAWTMAGLDDHADLDPRRCGIYLASGEMRHGHVRFLRKFIGAVDDLGGGVVPGAVIDGADFRVP